MRKVIIYVAGPYRNKSNWKIAQNIRKAEALCLEVWRAGMIALSPHLNTEHFQYELPDDVWLSGDLEMLRRCDAVLLVEGWESSNGTKAEVNFANDLGIPVFMRLDTLINAREKLEENLLWREVR